jgi:hypothetical protein
VLVQALDRDVRPHGGGDASTKDGTAVVPSAVKQQAVRDARSIWKRFFALGRIPVLRRPIGPRPIGPRPIGQGNQQTWRLAGDPLVLPVCQDGQGGQSAVRWSAARPVGKPGVLRSTRKRGKGVAEVASTLPEPDPAHGEGSMGRDRSVKMLAVVPFSGNGPRGVGHGGAQRATRRQFYAGRKQLHHAKKVRAIRKRQGKERRAAARPQPAARAAARRAPPAAPRGHSSPGATRREPPAHGTPTRWGQHTEGPQTPPPARDLGVRPARQVQRRERGTGGQSGGMGGMGGVGRPGLDQPDLPSGLPAQHGD